MRADFILSLVSLLFSLANSCLLLVLLLEVYTLQALKEVRSL